MNLYGYKTTCFFMHTITGLGVVFTKFIEVGHNRREWRSLLNLSIFKRVTLLVLTKLTTEYDNPLSSLNLPKLH